MNEILDIVVIMDSEQRAYLRRFAEQVGSVILIDEIAKYDIGLMSDFTVIQLGVMSSMRSKEEILRFLNAGLRFYCMRAEGSPYIFFPNGGDIVDLWYDFYDRANEKSFHKDMLTIKERFEMIYESSSYWSKYTPLTLMYSDIYAPEADDVLVELSSDSVELFVADDEVVVINEFTGECHNIDLTIGIPDDYFQIITLKTLENNK